VPYDRILDVVCRRCQEEVARRGVSHIHLPSGRTAVVCGRDPRESTEAANLLFVAATRVLPTLGRGAAPPLILRNEDLVTLLGRWYADKPQIIAEAIRALRKASGQLDAWILQVLDGLSFLRPVATAVRRELYGGGSDAR
jgi:hypothetical protein